MTTEDRAARLAAALEAEIASAQLGLRPWIRDVVLPAVIGAAGAVGLALLVGVGGMPEEVAWAIVGVVGCWAAVVTADLLWHRATSDPDEAAEAEATTENGR